MEPPIQTQPEEPADPQPTEKSDSNGMAIACFVCGLLGLLIFPPLLIVGIILYFPARKKESMKGLALAGLIISIAGVIIYLILLIGVVVFYAMVMKPSSFLPDRCTVDPPFTCVDFYTEDTDLVILLTQTSGGELTSMSVTAACSQESELFENVPNGETIEVIFSGCAFTKSMRTYFQIEYTKEGEELYHKSEGSVQLTE